MKLKIYILLYVVLFPSVLLAQDFSSSGLDPLTGHWQISNTHSPQGLNDNSEVYNWQMVSIPYQAVSIIFTDSLHGFLSHTNNGAMYSTNSGTSWTSISFNDTNFNGAYNSTYFINNNTGWCTGSAIQIRKTTNGGLNWFKQYGPPVAGIAHSIYFFDANTGFVFGSKNFPYVPFGAKTTNGGTNWAEIPLSFSGAQELNKQLWINSSTGWVAGYNVLLKTTDGGATFTNLFSNVPPTGNGYNDLLCIYFANAQTGWIGGSNLDKNNIYRTTNSGQNWVYQPNPVSLNNAYVQINDMEFMTQDSGWAIHGTPITGAIMFTTNGGTNWVTEEGSSHWFNSLSYYQRYKAWCAADNSVWIANLTPPLGISTYSNEIPNVFALQQNYPNPFNPSTRIRFDIPQYLNGRHVSLIVYDVLGKVTERLLDKEMTAGKYEFNWDAKSLSSGVYFYALSAGDKIITKKLILAK